MTFTAFKFDWTRAIRADRILIPAYKIVGECILDHVNQKTGTTTISDQLIADETALSIRTVQRARRALRKARWVELKRTRGTSVSRPLTDNLPTIAKEQADLRERRRQDDPPSVAFSEAGSEQDDPPSVAHSGADDPPSVVVCSTSTEALDPPSVTDDPPSVTRNLPRMADKHLSNTSLTLIGASDRSQVGKPESNDDHRRQPSEKGVGREEQADRPSAKPAPQPGASVSAADFATFWTRYPKRLGANPRVAAEKAYAKAIKAGADPAAILHGVERLTVEQRKDIGTPYIPQAVTWLNQERWRDYGDAPAAPTADMTPEQLKEQKRLDAIARNAGHFR